jgi:chorismate-pyruvate lyase
VADHESDSAAAMVWGRVAFMWRSGHRLEQAANSAPHVSQDERLELCRVARREEQLQHVRTCETRRVDLRAHERPLVAAMSTMRHSPASS